MKDGQRGKETKGDVRNWKMGDGSQEKEDKYKITCSKKLNPFYLSFISTESCQLVPKVFGML